MNQLFDLDSFDKHSKEQWIEQVSRELKSTAPWEKLTWHYEEEVEVGPIYFPEDLTTPLIGRHSEKSDNNWANLIPTRLPQTQEQLKSMRELDHFYDGYYLDLEASPKISPDLLSAMPVKTRLLMSRPNVTVAKSLTEGLTDYSGSLGYDPLMDSSMTTEFNEALSELYEQKGKDLQKLSIITIRGNELNTRGASIVQEIGIGLALLTEYYEALLEIGVPTGQVADEVDWAVAVGQDYFHEIAKMESIRLLSAMVQETFGLRKSEVDIHAFSSFRYKSTKEETNNIIRNTGEAFAAVAGGCRSLCIYPHLLGDWDLHARRIGLNVSNILKEESFMSRVKAPASGSYYLETLTRKLSAASWSFFQEIEGLGGFRTVKKSGWLDQKIQENKLKQSRKVDDGELNLIGVNKFPSDQEGKNSLNDEVFRLSQNFEK